MSASTRRAPWLLASSAAMMLFSSSLVRARKKSMSSMFSAASSASSVTSPLRTSVLSRAEPSALARSSLFSISLT